MRVEIPDGASGSQVRAAALSAALDLAEITGPPVILGDLLEAARRIAHYLIEGK